MLLQKQKNKAADMAITSMTNTTAGYNATLMKLVCIQILLDLNITYLWFHPRRLTAFSVFEDPSLHTYAFDKLPTDREWGICQPFDDNPL